MNDLLDSTNERTITYSDGEWLEGNPGIIRPRDHASWLASTVFDGARSMERCVPDLDLHCARLIESARIMGLEPPVTAERIVELSWEGVEKFEPEAHLYIRPMMYGVGGFVIPDPTPTGFMLVIHESEFPAPTGFRASLSSFRRPSPECAPTMAKASCLYPNVARAMAEAKRNGCDTGVMLDPAGNVAEFSLANLFIARGGVVTTPVTNNCFLNGITRQRTIQLLRDDGVEVVEKTLGVEDLREAEEAFGTGNNAKVAPCVGLLGSELPIGPIFKRAYELYLDFAKTQVRNGVAAGSP